MATLARSLSKSVLCFMPLQRQARYYLKLANIFIVADSLFELISILIYIV